MLYDHLEGWEGDARGRTCGDICICIADSLWYKAETNTTVKQLYSNKDVKKKIECRIDLIPLYLTANHEHFAAGRRLRVLPPSSPDFRSSTTLQTKVRAWGARAASGH